MLRWIKVLWLVVASNVNSFNHSEWFTPVYHYFAMLKFVYDVWLQLMLWSKEFIPDLSYKSQKLFHKFTTKQYFSPTFFTLFILVKALNFVKTGLIPANCTAPLVHISSSWSDLWIWITLTIFSRKWSKSFCHLWTKWIRRQAEVFNLKSFLLFFSFLLKFEPSLTGFDQPKVFNRLKAST